jgi:sulfoxide reductase heme-binding subunit YedZ
MTDRPQQPRPGDLRRRSLRHYLPVALAAGVVLVLVANVASLNVNRNPVPLDIFTEGISGALPSGDEASSRMDHDSPTGASSTSQGSDPRSESSTEPPAMDHDSGTGSAPMDHDSGTGSAPMDHDSGTGSAPMDHDSGTGSAPMDHDSGTGSPPMDHDSGTEDSAAGAGAETAGGGQQGAPPAGDGEGQAGAGRQGHADRPDTVRLMRRLSTVTGYLALGLIGVTLLIGPANLVLRRRTPVSSYLRRDIGILAAVASAVHVVFGLLVKHGDGTILSYFLHPTDRTRILTTSFGLANWTGLAALLIAIGLAAISSDAALRKLKAKRWKRIQRLNYLLFTLVVAHALLYGALWRETSPYTVTLGLIVLAVVMGQAIGVRLTRQRHAASAAAG